MEKNRFDFAPRVHHLDKTICPDYAVVMDFIEGKVEPEFNRDLLDQLAKMLSQLHKIQLEKQEHGYEWIVHNYSEIARYANKYLKEVNPKYYPTVHLIKDEVLPVVKKLIEKKKHYFTIGFKAFSHTDLSEDNFILDKNGKLWLIYWENAEVTGISNELSYFMSHTWKLPEQEHKYFVERYKKYSPKTKSLNFFKQKEIFDYLDLCCHILWGIDFASISEYTQEKRDKNHNVILKYLKKVAKALPELANDVKKELDRLA